MLVLSPFIDELMGEGVDKTPQILPLTIIFFVLCFLEATQDISVDGWALTMLKRCNIGNKFNLCYSAHFLNQNFLL